MNPTSFLRAAALCLAAGFTATALAAGDTAAGDQAAGRIKALPCMGCHGIPGYFNVYPTYRVPRVAGQHAAYLIAALEAYKSGQRSHETMQAQAATLTAQDMADIAAFFAAAAKPGSRR